MFGALVDTGNPDASLAFQYLFALFTTLQGFSIFLFYCVFNETACECIRARGKQQTSSSRKTTTRSMGTSRTTDSSRQTSFKSHVRATSFRPQIARSVAPMLVTRGYLDVNSDIRETDFSKDTLVEMTALDIETVTVTVPETPTNSEGVMFASAVNHVGEVGGEWMVNFNDFGEFGMNTEGDNQGTFSGSDTAPADGGASQWAVNFNDFGEMGGMG
jgi:hypothetical protein